VAVTPSGSSWVGYFDEGVFGNFGWGGPGPEPIGRFGINCFGSDLRLAAHAPAEYEIADCDAMNVVEESVFACCYTDWDIVRLSRSDEPRAWTNEVAGASQIVVSEHHVALVGGYGESRDRVVVGQLTADRFEPVTTTSLLIDGRVMSGDELLRASGSSLHALAHGRFYRWDLS
jgi:hypothetical protein